MPGFLLIDKPTTWTSFDVVAYLRGVTKTKKIGHAGTLDPFATGLLIVGVGREATKRIDEFKGMEKEYIATIELGKTSTTFDTEGEITKHDTCNMTPEEKSVRDVLHTFVGNIEQIPPMYSAKKVNGKKLYELARKGIEVERKPHHVKIFEIELLKYTYPNLQIKVTCGTGTYIRTLADDIGKKLETGAYCTELRRTKIGEYSVEHAVGPKDLENDTFEERLIN